jgi:mRNA-degrading endonuclease RelE of RelBE toxin-antitoxin system
MAKYKIRVHDFALQDIQQATDWYNGQSKGLGSRFQKQAKAQINSLKKNPLGYAIRYADVRCMLVKKFPFLVHFNIDENQHLVEVFAVYHTSRDPKIWMERRQ